MELDTLEEMVAPDVQLPRPPHPVECVQCEGVRVCVVVLRCEGVRAGKGEGLVKALEMEGRQ